MKNNMTSTPALTSSVPAPPSLADTAIVMEPLFQAVAKAPLNIAPERSAELIADVFKGKTWDLVGAKGSPPGGVQPFAAYPDDSAISVSYSGLAMVWCIALFAVFLLDVVKGNRGEIGGAIRLRAVSPELLETLKRYLDYAESLRQKDENWPSCLKAPELESDCEAINEANQLFSGAVSWLFLHEIAHVHLDHKCMSHRSVDQEDEADKFASEWIFKHVPEPEREFRILVVGVALAWLMMFAPIGGDNKHPPAHYRIIHVSSYFGADEDSVALEVVSNLFKALFFPNMIPPTTLENSLQLFEWTTDTMRDLANGG